MTENELRTFLNVSDNYPNDNDELDEFLQSEGLNDVANVDNLGDVLGISAGIFPIVFMMCFSTVWRSSSRFFCLKAAGVSNQTDTNFSTVSFLAASSFLASRLPCNGSLSNATSALRFLAISFACLSVNLSKLPIINS